MFNPGEHDAEKRCLSRLSVAACALDANLNIHQMNSAAVGLLRLQSPLDDVPRLLDHVHPQDRASTEMELREALQKDASIVLCCRVGDAHQWVLTDLHLGHAAGDGPRLVVMTPNRVFPSTAKGAADPRAAGAGRADDQAEEWRRFAYTVAHDLRVPLVTMESNLRLMQQDLAASRTASLSEDLAEIDSAVRKMKRLVVELLDLARIGRLDLIAASHSHAVDDIDLNEVVDQVIREVLSGNPGWNGLLRRLNRLPTVRGRTTQLTEVFQNLVDNAVKYTAGIDNPQVEVDCQVQPEGATIVVRDNGPGVPVGDRSRVFDLFVQLRPDASGVGIGLAIVRSIVSSHGGRVWIEDGLDGRGCAFCVFLNSPVCAP
ncbi:MAG TPA: HAMP domain-containing sensor histidine kinase [Caulifigura sp.]|nr:HAMP domain-containing sensor histidine kinase [Caulifigura sp.]